MKVESMASKKRPSRTQTDPTELRVGKIVERRATTPGIFTNEQQETNRNSSRRKLSADNTHRSLFPKTARTSYDDVLPTEHWTSTAVDQPVKLQMGERTLGQKPITIMSVLRLNVEKYPDRQAYGYNVDDTWHHITYKELFDLVRRAAKGFISFGLQRYSGVAIIGRNTHEWAIANFAAIYAGGIVVPIATAISVDDCCSMIERTRCSIVVVGSTKQLDIVAQFRKKLFYIKAVILYGKDDDAKSVHFYTWDRLLSMGDTVDDERLKERMAFQAPNLCCTIMHSPGTAGPPKPVMISQDNLVWTARSFGRRMSCSHASGVVVSIMSFAHMSGLMFDLYVPLLFASTLYFLPNRNIFEWTNQLHPTTFYAPFLIFEELRLKMTSRLTRSCISRLIFLWAKSVGLKGNRAITSRRPMPICWPLANALVFKKVRTTLGLQNSREIFVAGRSMSVQAAEFFAGLNIPVLGIFGMTETSGPFTVSAMPEMFRFTSVGKDLDGCSSKIVHPDKDGFGDLRIRGRNIFMGYLHQPDMTNEAFDKEGWMKTGDVLRKDDDGFLYVRGKTAELVTLESGDAIAPDMIETRFREELPFIRNCMLVGEGRPYLAMLIAIKTVVDWQTFEVSNVLTPDSRQWFQKLGYQDESIDRFLENPDKKILNKIQSIIDRLNAREDIPSHRIRKWTILPRDFTVQSGELNWTLRLRRFYVAEKYAETIDSLYIEK